MQKRIFITSVGTEIGKTYVTCLEVAHLLEQGIDAIAVKPVISGYEEYEHTDLTELLKSQNPKIPKSQGLKYVDDISLFKFKEPVSPDIAAKMENAEAANVKDIKRYIDDLDNDVVLIEGVGGLCVPLNDDETTLDLIKALNCDEIWLVSSNYLGALSHTISAVKNLPEISKIIISQNVSDISVDLGSFVDSLKNHINKPVFTVKRGGYSIDKA